MNKLKLAVMAMIVSGNVTAFAGGILTNTNQSISFLRNPARDAAIGLDGVYSNPAGVAFLNEGFHLGINWQYAHQTRTITSTNPYLALGRKNQGLSEKSYEGVADAPCIPSIQAAYNKGDWSFQFNFSVPGGGGKCEFADGLGSFESVVGNIASKFMTLDGFATQLNAATNKFAPLYTALGGKAPAAIPTYGVSGYDMDGYMQGRQYYFGFQIGTAYKINKDLSVYGGLRLLYGTATYKAKISNIQVKTGEGYINFGDFLPNVAPQAMQDASVAASHLDILNKAQQAGIPMTDEMKNAQTSLAEGLNSLKESQGQLSTLAKYSEGVNLLCNQSSLGIAPIIGVDYRFKNFNFAAKYEFKTQIRMKNESTVNEASEIAAVNKFRDGEEVNEDAPALLTVGVQWSPIENVRVNAGYHHFFDKDADWYNNTQQQLAHNTSEYLFGAEWDINEKFTVSAGGQITDYGLTDKYMNDMSFVVDSYSVGFGFEYKLNDMVKLSASYFQTNYSKYDRVTSTQPRVSDTFTRTNRVLGIGCELTF